MKLLETEIMEYTTPTVDAESQRWDEVILKITKSEENMKIVGEQIALQLEHYSATVEEAIKHLEPYKFSLDLREWLLEGCFLTDIDYRIDTHVEVTIRYDNATEIE